MLAGCKPAIEERALRGCSVKWKSYAAGYGPKVNPPPADLSRRAKVSRRRPG